MGYTLEALLLNEQIYKAQPEALQRLPVVPLFYGLSLVPLTDDLFDKLPPIPEVRERPEEFWKFSAALEALALELSRFGAVAYVEADFFGGEGTQAAAVWEEGLLCLGPLKSAGVGAINTALQWLGIPSSQGRDGFEIVGLLRHRHTAGWLEDAEFIPNP